MRRLKRLVVHGYLFATLCRGVFEVVANEFPPDAEVVGAEWSERMQSVVLTVESAAYPEVPWGELPPLAEAPALKLIQRAEKPPPVASGL